MSNVIDTMPEGHHLYAYDDCGIDDRQPHIVMDDCYLWTFNTSDTDADMKARSSVFSYKKINAVYNDLDPKRSYILAMTYSNDHVYNRIQSLWADDVELHGPLTLPKGKAIRVLVKVPTQITQDGKMKLEVKIHGEVNATVGIIEIWADGEPTAHLPHLTSFSSLYTGPTGFVTDIGYDPLSGAEVTLNSLDGKKTLAKTQTNDAGWFAFDKKALKIPIESGDLQIMIDHKGQHLTRSVPVSDMKFEPVRYRPIPESLEGLKEHVLSLDGIWRLNPTPVEGWRDGLLIDPGWGGFQVPGQWVEQGYDLPQDKPVAVSREFDVPKKWAGYRVILRFDAIHGGTRYWLNGKELGYSEVLFTPVEWDITDFVRFDEPNRIDLEMKVETVSERLSFSSGYAFHNLGGIDRAVKIYALPQVHIKDLRLATDLDEAYRDASLAITLTLENQQKEPPEGLTLHALLYDANGKSVDHSTSKVSLGVIPQGKKTIEISTQVENPLKWTAETPNLYKLVLELRDGKKILEKVERNVGFRKIEIKGSQVYINGAVIKIAGSCHHELDPLTGRADTMRYAEGDVKLLKQANLNYIRTSHYPPNMELVDAADRLGVYLEVEAPFCWVGPTDSLDHLREVLTPTSAMIDYYHTHPSVIIWSIANESHFNKAFEVSNEMIKELDPSRVTTFNNPDPNRVCDTLNLHYPPMPYDECDKADPRPMLLGEYFFPICHEQTDVMINPGLRELWGHGQAEPDSDWAKACAKSFDTPHLKPGARPGVWDSMYHSDRILGGAIWASLDEPFYLPGGKRAGYAWVHGFWGLIDGWRRPKPEWELSRLIFTPVWFPEREVGYSPGKKSVLIPVENRFSFTNLSELTIDWEIDNHKGVATAKIPPSATGEIQIPIPRGTKEGDKAIIRVTDAHGELINVVAIRLGKETRKPLPEANAGMPRLTSEGEKKIVIKGDGFSLVFDSHTGDFDAANAGHKSALLSFPTLHITRYDFGDLAGPKSPPYAIFPDVSTRVVENAIVKAATNVEITIQDRYKDFAGTIVLTLDKKGVGKVSYDYLYSGEEMNTREAGVRFGLKPECDEIQWRRWSEWGVFPEDCISRTEGHAKARRDGAKGTDPDGVRPTWEWRHDQTEMGTNDFRSVKFNIYEAGLLAPDGSGLSVYANADAHVRPALTEHGVNLHVLSRCWLGQVPIRSGDRISGEFVVRLRYP